MKGFPTSSDIYLELDGKKVAVVQSYTAKASKSSRSVEAFGESEPVATIEGQKKYTLELTRLYATDGAVSDGIDFHELKDFSLVICKPDRKVIYSGCESRHPGGRTAARHGGGEDHGGGFQADRDGRMRDRRTAPHDGAGAVSAGHHGPGNGGGYEDGPERKVWDRRKLRRRPAGQKAISPKDADGDAAKGVGAAGRVGPGGAGPGAWDRADRGTGGGGVALCRKARGRLGGDWGNGTA